MRAYTIYIIHVYTNQNDHTSLCVGVSLCVRDRVGHSANYLTMPESYENAHNKLNISTNKDDTDG